MKPNLSKPRSNARPFPNAHGESTCSSKNSIGLACSPPYKEPGEMHGGALHAMFQPRFDGLSFRSAPRPIFKWSCFHSVSHAKLSSGRAPSFRTIKPFSIAIAAQLAMFVCSCYGLVGTFWSLSLVCPRSRTHFRTHTHMITTRTGTQHGCLAHVIPHWVYLYI